MPEACVAFGDVIAGALTGSLTLPEARATWDALVQGPEFTVLEARRYNRGDRYAEILVVVCENDGVPSRNPVGIAYRETLGLLFHSKPELRPEVRALRVGFPATPHQNHVTRGEPPSLCLHF